MCRVPGHHPGQQIPAPGRRERLDDLRHLRQRVGHLLQMPLRHLDVHEGEQRVAQRRGRQPGAVRRDHAVPLQPVQPRLHRPAGDPQHPGVLPHAGARLVQQQPEDLGVQSVDGHGRTDSLRSADGGFRDCTNGPQGGHLTTFRSCQICAKGRVSRSVARPVDFPAPPAHQRPLPVSMPTSSHGGSPDVRNRQALLASPLRGAQGGVDGPSVRALPRAAGGSRAVRPGRHEL